MCSTPNIWFLKSIATYIFEIQKFSQLSSYEYGNVKNNCKQVSVDDPRPGTCISEDYSKVIEISLQGLQQIPTHHAFSKHFSNK